MEDSLLLLLDEIDRLKSELDGLRPLSAEREERVMQKFRLDWNYHSNAIEGNALTYGETRFFLMEGLTAKGKPFKDHLDLRGHDEGISFLLDLVQKEVPLSEKIIRELHKIILVEPYHTDARTTDGRAVKKRVNLGKYKELPNHVKTSTGSIHYYAMPEETPAKMEELIMWLRETRQMKTIHTSVLAARFHHRFAAIHPFDDGNGRMARLLMNLILMQDGYTPVVIKKEDRNEYYAALSQADAGETVPFSIFVAEHLKSSLELYLRAAKGENIEEPSDWEKQVALLKRAAEAKMSNAVHQQADRKSKLAGWLKINVPIIRKEFAHWFEPFNSFFSQTVIDSYAQYSKNLGNVQLENWEEIAREIVDGVLKPELNFSYHCVGFIGVSDKLKSPSVVFKITDDAVILGSQKWPIASVLPIDPQSLSDIQACAKDFYRQIEAALTH